MVHLLKRWFPIVVLNFQRVLSPCFLSWNRLNSLRSIEMYWVFPTAAWLSVFVGSTFFSSPPFSLASLPFETMAFPSKHCLTQERDRYPQCPFLLRDLGKWGYTMVFCGVSHSWCSNNSMLVFPPKRVPFFRHGIWRARTSLTSVRTSKKSASSEGSEPGDLVNQGIPERQIDVEAMASWPHGPLMIFRRDPRCSMIFNKGLTARPWVSTDFLACVKLNQTDSEVEYIASSAWFKVEIYSVLDWDTTNKIMTKIYNGDKANTNQ